MRWTNSNCFYMDCCQKEHAIINYYKDELYACVWSNCDDFESTVIYYPTKSTIESIREDIEKVFL